MIRTTTSLLLGLLLFGCGDSKYADPIAVDTIFYNGKIVTLDVTTLLSSDKKFASGMYRSGKTHFEIDEPYGVDEFIFFLDGSVTLTSADGSVQVINAGEGVTVPKE